MNFLGNSIGQASKLFYLIVTFEFPVIASETSYLPPKNFKVWVAPDSGTVQPSLHSYLEDYVGHDASEHAEETI